MTVLSALCAWRIKANRAILAAPERFEMRGGSVRYARDFGLAADGVLSSTRQGAWWELATRHDVVEIYLNNLAITDDDLRVMRRFPSLKELDIRNTPVTDAGLRFLEGCNLETLWLAGTRVSAAGVRSFQQKKPLCEVIH